MSTLLVIVLAIGLWLGVVLVVVAVCRAAQRGDEAMMRERRPSVRVAIEDPVADPTRPRARALMQDRDERRRLRDRARPVLPSTAQSRRRSRRDNASRR